MEEQAELIKYSAKTKINFLMQPFVILMLIKRNEINFFEKKKIRNHYQNQEKLRNGH